MTADDGYDDFEGHVRETLADATGYACEKQYEVGKSGNRWKVDCVLLDDHDLRKGYVEVKETSRSSNRSTYINHMRRAYAEMGDFRQFDAPKAVVVADKWDTGGTDWAAMMDSIDCLLVDIDEIDRFVAELDA
jgi:vacuolar-type H+-ATPase subunit B/Vma2